MVKAWLLNNSYENNLEDNHCDPCKYITLKKLKESTGVEHFEVDVDDIKNDEKYWKLRKDRGYDYEDLVEISEEKMGKEELEAKLKIFFSEHLHDYEEIRLFLEGSGYFDVRDNQDNWIRIQASKNDLLVLPGGIYHRFTLDKTRYAKVLRLFCGIPVWTAKFRPEADSESSRQQYLNNLLKQAA